MANAMETDWKKYGDTLGPANPASYHIRVNSVAPAEVMTPQYEKWLMDSDQVRQRSANHPA